MFLQTLVRGIKQYLNNKDVDKILAIKLGINKKSKNPNTIVYVLSKINYFEQQHFVEAYRRMFNRIFKDLKCLNTNFNNNLVVSDGNYEIINDEINKIESLDHKMLLNKFCRYKVYMSCKNLSFNVKFIEKNADIDCINYEYGCSIRCCDVERKK